MQFSSAGRRLELLEIFEKQLNLMGLPSNVGAIDCSPFAPTILASKTPTLAPRCGDPSFVGNVLQVCEQANTQLLIPLIDTELLIYSQNRKRFLDVGVLVNVSGPETIGICRDKLRFGEFLAANGFLAIPSISGSEADERIRKGEPLVVKPRFGSSSVGIQRVAHIDEFAPIWGASEKFVLQPLIVGTEYSADVFVDGGVRAISIREQISMHGGETSVGRISSNEEVRSAVNDLVATLPDAFGLLNVDLIYSEADSRIYFLEINPRFPGGYPLSHNAGFPAVQWLIQLGLGESPDYDRAVNLRSLTVTRHLSSTYFDSDSAKILFRSR